jgi:hypothetical protein
MRAVPCSNHQQHQHQHQLLPLPPPLTCPPFPHSTRRGFTCPKHAYEQLKRSPPPAWPRSQPQWALQLERYVVDIDDMLSDLSDVTQEAQEVLQQMPAAQRRLLSEVAVSAFGHGNITTYVNDPLPDPVAHPDKWVAPPA